MYSHYDCLLQNEKMRFTGRCQHLRDLMLFLQVSLHREVEKLVGGLEGRQAAKVISHRGDWWNLQDLNLQVQLTI